MQNPLFAFEDEEPHAPALPLKADQKQRLIELMAQAIQKVLQHAHDGENHDCS
jgi:hypothetical protein